MTTKIASGSLDDLEATGRACMPQDLGDHVGVERSSEERFSGRQCGRCADYHPAGLAGAARLGAPANSLFPLAATLALRRTIATSRTTASGERPDPD